MPVHGFVPGPEHNGLLKGCWESHCTDDSMKDISSALLMLTTRAATPAAYVWPPVW